jgi:DNA repair protein RecO
VSYHIYTTPSIILSSRPFREADRVYSILTKDLGLIRATATGVRKEESKLRGALEPVTLSSVSLVRGQEYWRITSAQVIEPIAMSREIARPLLLLEKLIQGEAHHPELFVVVEEALLEKTRGDLWEVSLVAKILFHLGYLKESDLQLEKKELIQAINEGLEQSQLT